MPGLYFVYALWWLFFFWQVYRAEKMCKREPQRVPWALDPPAWFVYKMLVVILGESRAKEYAEARRNVIRTRYCRFARMAEFLALVFAVLSLLQCLLSVLTT